mmetsp:Transcript_28245/g.57835  ORF Transcript_28245/g.57835 Transcript_28245/m.57835 type:complete len:163 (+) Transcript_28245:1-489(+)
MCHVGIVRAEGWFHCQRGNARRLQDMASSAVCWARPGGFAPPTAPAPVLHSSHNNQTESHTPRTDQCCTPLSRHPYQCVTPCTQTTSLLQSSRGSPIILRNSFIFSFSFWLCASSFCAPTARFASSRASLLSFCRSTAALWPESPPMRSLSFMSGLAGRSLQ